MTDPALGLNLLLRGAAMSVLLLIAAMLWREHPRSTATRLGAFFAISVLATTIASMPGFAPAPTDWRLLIAAVTPGTMFLFWLFTRALFDDDFALRPWHALMWVALAVAGVVSCAAGEAPTPAPWVPALRLTLGILPVAWALLSIAQSVASSREDLVERRRQLRTLIVSTTAFYTVAQLLVALLAGLSLPVVFESTANAGGIAALSLFVGWRLLRPGRGGLFEAAPPSAATAESHHSDPAALAATAVVVPGSLPTPLDAKHIETLDKLMAIDHLYREPSLSIGSVAQRMGLPEHKLRRLINQGLGHRNFSAFLNAHRLADARRWLADPEQRDTPILTIAMDAGFQSIGPFNRAFKANTGITPSEFRRLRGQLPSPELRADLAESGIG
jgi:AraC-like DNA-binding protein